MGNDTIVSFSDPAFGDHFCLEAMGPVVNTSSEPADVTWNRKDQRNIDCERPAEGTAQQPRRAGASPE